MNERIENKRVISNITPNSDSSIAHTSRLLLTPQTQSALSTNHSNHEYNNAKKCKYHRVRQQDQRSQQIPRRAATSNIANNNQTSSSDPIAGTQFLANSKLISDRYLVFDTMDGSSFYNCIDISDKTPLQCKVTFFALFWVILLFKHH